MSAKQFFNNGYNCSEAVLLAGCKKLGVKSELVPRISTGFGGGMGCGSICGAATDAIMVLSLKYGRDDNNEKLIAYSIRVASFYCVLKKSWGALFATS